LVVEADATGAVLSAPQPRELVHFLLLNEAEKRAAILRMARNGWSDYGIAAATKISVEQVRLIIGEQK
jgi:DNA-binding NarL/FixJ family response regulator